MIDIPQDLLSGFFTWLLGAALSVARIAPVFYMMPFLNTNLLTGMMRSCVIIFVGAGIWSPDSEVILNLDRMTYVGLAARETIVGTLVGFLLVWPFWVFQALGSFIDNQRGATLSSSIDPANGIETSELANMLGLFSVIVYLQGGGLIFMLETVARSYSLCDPLGSCTPNLRWVTTLTTTVVGKAIMLASPVIAALLMSEALLGILSRFAAQLNAFSVSLTIKSAVAFIIILIYFSPIFPKALLDMVFSASLSSLF